MKYNKLLALILAILICCSACAKKQPVTYHPEEPRTIQDLKDFPQNLEIYANKNKPDSALLSVSDQKYMAESYREIFFGPWQMQKTSVSRKDITPFFKKARGYKDDKNTWQQAEWDLMADNANLKTYPNRNQPGIILRQTDLRELPTHLPRFSQPTSIIKDNPFDYFQYSLLWPGMPLLIAHTTKDSRWHYVECPIASGWVDANDVAFVSADFKNEFESHELAALIKEKVVLPGTGINGSDSTAGIGTVLPLASAATAAISIIIPVADSMGFARPAEIDLPIDSAAIMPYTITPANVALVGNNMMGQQYGWGGTMGERDCSSLMRDLFAPFGIWLPRNSLTQARRGSVISLQNLPVAEKTKIILQDGVPFLSLLGMRGHIGLYIGEWQNKPAIFHNTWGLRIIKEGNDNERFVIGKTVVTSITPGMELENLYRPVTFVDRLRTLTRLGPKR